MAIISARADLRVCQLMVADFRSSSVSSWASALSVGCPSSRTVLSLPAMESEAKALNPASSEENSASANLNARTLTKQKVSSGTLGQTHADRIVGKLSTEAKGKQTANGSDFQNRGTKEKKLKQDNSGSPKQTREKNHGKKGSHTMLGQPKPTEDEKRRLKFENALKWDGAPLTRGQPQWQRLDTDFRALVYSAHFDDVDEPPLVRVVGIVDETLPYQNVTCRFYDRDGRFCMHSVSGTIYRFRGRNGRK